MIRIPEWRAGILLAVILLLCAGPYHYNNSVISSEKLLSTIPVHQNNNVPIDTSINANTTHLLFDDEFNTMPFGLNTSLWNLTTHSNPPITWKDNEKLVLGAEPLSYVILNSTVKTGLNVAAELNLTFSEGLCYFGVGWSDRVINPSNDWQANLRCSYNGVFIDYWDKELCFVCYSNGERIATPVDNISFRTEHQYRIEWRSTLVKLFVDNVERAVISRRIPQKSLHFVIATSGHYETSGYDQLSLDYVRVSSLSSINLDQPNINLIWPMNGSQVSHYDFIDFDLRSWDGILLYSWDRSVNETIVAPWDLIVPQTLGLHRLQVFSKNLLGIWNSSVFSFEVVQQSMVRFCPEMKRTPLIDGIIEDNEKSDSSASNIFAMNENRDFEELSVYISFRGQTAYIGVESQLADRWNSRLSILIDGNGDGKWNSADPIGLQDIRVAVGTPSSYGSSLEVYSPDGSKISKSEYPGLVAASSVLNKKASFELLFNLTSVKGNASKGMGIGIIITRGGYESYFPAHLGYGIFSDLLIAKSSGITQPDSTFSFFMMGGIALLVLFGLFGGFYIASTRQKISLESNLNNEELDRIKTLLYSYDRISLDRLARLSGIDKNRVEKLVQKLVSRGLVDVSIIEFEQEFMRELQEFEKGTDFKDGGEII